MDQITPVEKKGSKHMLLWGIVILITLLVLTLIGLLVFKTNPQNDDSTIEQADIRTEKSESAKVIVKFEQLAGFFTGTREGLDGTVEPVLVEFNSLNYEENTFKIVVNIGVNTKLNGFGKFYVESGMIESDILSNLICFYDDNNKMVIKSSGESNNIYKLMKE
ncbi:hypothetical protein MASR1M45_07000 [Candidatus Kapaibacterium sp.]